MQASRDNYTALCAAVGEMSIAWAQAEQTLDLCVTIVFKHCGGSKLRDDLPRSLSVKTKFMRDAFRKLPTVKHLAKLGIGVMDKMDAIAEQRNDMIHGAFSISRVNGRWHFLKFDYGKDIHTARDLFFSTGDFRLVGRKTLDLEADLLHLSNHLKRLAPWPR